MRLQKTVPVGRAQASLFRDVFNLNNQGVIERNSVVETSGATFGIPQIWSVPRTVQIALRLEF